MVNSSNKKNKNGGSSTAQKSKNSQNTRGTSSSQKMKNQKNYVSQMQENSKLRQNLSQTYKEKMEECEPIATVSKNRSSIQPLS